MSEVFAERLAAAITAREEGRDDQARGMLLALQDEWPDDAMVNLQCAWIHDKMGLEAEAVPFYEKALETGLEDIALNDALLGLGSTYRALGRYREALKTLDRGVEEFPGDQGMKVFRAMALYNNGRSKEACETLLSVIATTSQTGSVARYQPAIFEYAEDLDRVWT
jgi:tetratricopeptide (TPR) repeat protein